MKHSRRMVSAALAAVLAAGMVIPTNAAKVGEIVNYALHTNIVAQINGHALRSYNVNDRTAIVAEDLEDYGFKVAWDPAARTLKVERTMDEEGKPKNPVKYPDYEKGALKAPAGSRAEAILSTDIVAYVAGKQVESFNIDGQTLIWLSDLAGYGNVTWDAEKAIANVELGDPLEYGVGQVVKELKNWAGEKAEYQLFEGENGTLFVGYYHGTSHGTACVMEYVDKAGKRTRIDQLLPAIGFGAQYYVRPRSILVGADNLIFTTTFQASGQAGGEWRDHIMTVDLNKMILKYAQPVQEIPEDRIDQWDYTFKQGDAQTDATQPLVVKLQKKSGSNELEVVDSSIPFPGIEVQVTHFKVVVTVGNRTHEGYVDTPYGKAYYALAKSEIPSMFRSEELGIPFRPGNNDTQRRYIRSMFQVMIDDEYVNGALCWIGINGKRCLRYDFDHVQTLEDGEIITVKMGVPL